ncbi:RING-type E3 ubiquitin-protein ligase PPIL2-like [Ornithodoros turicata]|uniref:RING-type E3 ubiquitin-protein ligase PPIL2-like n=1 Tax=Ornithodoros turicata TaxID=34597 RepID=UPI003138B49C
MGKRQHQKDKMYLTTTEWTDLYGGRKKRVDVNSEFKRLPFDHCALSLQPFTHPLCTLDGAIYDLENIVPFLKKFGVDPATGKPLDAKSLVRLNWTRNSEGEYHCPVLYKVFTENSHIVAIRTTGNVFSYEAVEQLNIRAKNWKDLLNDEPFTRTDIITLQDPANLDKFNLAKFHHLKNNLRVIDPEEERMKSDPKYTLRVLSTETKATLSALENEYTAPVREGKQLVRHADKTNAAHYSTGAVAAASTSTVMMPETTHEPAILSEDVVRYALVKKKGYVQLVTTHGNLNLELYCNVVPKTCDNFIRLCQKGYYKGTKFHRSIRNFILQGGDPTGTGKGGESVWGKPFKDEIKPNLVHQGRGVLSMANEGPNTNGSQFFITYRSCRHLDSKHTIFGKLVGGLEALTTIEAIETDNKDRPIEDVFIRDTLVFVDPFQEVDTQLEKERQQQPVEEPVAKPQQPLKEFHSGIGKYIDLALCKKKPAGEPVNKKQKLVPGMQFKDFSAW